MSVRRSVLAAVALCAAGPVFGQTCAGEILGTVASDAVSLSWVAPTHRVDNTPIHASIAVRYVVYEVVNGQNVLRCTTPETVASFSGLSVGTHSWRVAAMTEATDPPWVAGELSNVFSKTTGLTPAPESRARLRAPTGLTGR
jgi:hypothetical protein